MYLYVGAGWNNAVCWLFTIGLSKKQMSYKTRNTFRKAHRFLGLFIGIQFLFWTVSGVYFSWTDIDEIHGDHYRKAPSAPSIPPTLFGDSLLKNISTPIQSLALKNIGGDPFLWINNAILLNVKTAQIQKEILKKI